MNSKMEPAVHQTRLRIAIRAITVWLILIVAEILHGIARGIFLVPHVGEFRSSQIGVFTGSMIILAIAVVFVRWIGATRPAHLLIVGFLWLALTLAFEILFGRFVCVASDGWSCPPCLRLRATHLLDKVDFRFHFGRLRATEGYLDQSHHLRQALTKVPQPCLDLSGRRPHEPPIPHCVRGTAGVGGACWLLLLSIAEH